MNIVSALVLFAVIWFMCLFVALPIRIKSQSEDNNVVPGTPASAPVDPMLKNKLIWVSIAAVSIWAPICAIIISNVFTIEDLDFFNRL